MRKEEKHVGGMKQQQAHLHPPGLKAHPPEFTSLPLPPIHPSPRTRPVFEDACRGGLCSGHKITVWVRGLDTSVRCYPLTHIPTEPF